MIEKIKSILNLTPHIEGGYFHETYRSKETISGKGIPVGYNGDRNFSSAIYYLLTPGTFSAIHRLKSDEIFHFYLGSPVEMLQLCPDGAGKILNIGVDILNGMQPQVIAPKHVWQGARLKPGGEFALMGTTVAPGFEYTDYEPGKREELISSYPEFGEMIRALTKDE